MDVISAIFWKVLKLAGLFKYFFAAAFRGEREAGFCSARQLCLLRIKLGVNSAIPVNVVRSGQGMQVSFHYVWYTRRMLINLKLGLSFTAGKWGIRYNKANIGTFLSVTGICVFKGPFECKTKEPLPNFIPGWVLFVDFYKLDLN